MNRLENLFSQKKRNILNIYFTAGYPTLDSLPTLAKALDDSGVDIIEIGMPYSDPLADGKTIQESSEAALKTGMHLDLLFDQVRTLRNQSTIPIILMGYLNQVIQYGEDKFLQTCSTVGVDGLIIPDMPLDIYEETYKSKFEGAQMTISFLVTPQTSDERIGLAAKLSSGFLYVVSSSSITGAKSSIEKSQTDYFERVNKLKNETPSLIGFGIHDKATYNMACKYSNGAIIGSQFIRSLKNNGSDFEAISTFVNSIR